MLPTELNDLLKAQIDSVCEMLLPGGKRQGNRYITSDITGGTGQSLKVEMTGPRKGLWVDYNGKDGGDLIRLWERSKRSTFIEALSEIKRFLGIESKNPFPEKKKYKRPAKPPCKAIKKETPAFDWLTEERNLKESTLEAYKIAFHENEVIFPYLRNGELVMYKKREIRGKSQSSSSETEPCLFGWQAIPEDAREVTLAEGEIDCMSYYDQGIPAMSVPYGGGGGNKQRWIEYEFDNLERFDKIYISMDMDSTGEEALKEIIHRLGAYRCYVVNLPKKDANDVHMDGGFLKPFLDSAKRCAPKELSNSTEHFDEVINLFYPNPSADLGMSMPWDKYQNLFKFRSNELTIWSGYSSQGKSLILGQVVLGGIQQGYRFCVASMEMPPARTLHRIYKQASGVNLPTIEYAKAINIWLDENLYFFDVIGTALQDKLIDALKYARRCFGVKHFIIDSLAKCGIAEDDYNAQKKFIDRLFEITKEFDCHIHLVIHARKGSDDYQMAGKFDVKGTGALTDMADNVFIVYRNKRKEDLQEEMEEEGYVNTGKEEKVLQQPDARLICKKNRVEGKENSFRLWFHEPSQQYVSEENQSPNIYVPFSVVQ